MDTEEAQEFGKEIVAKATERKLRRQEYARYQQRRQQTVEYDFPKPGTSPVPQLEKPREKRETRPQSVLSNFEVPNYEEIAMFSGKPSIMSRSVPATPQQNKEKEELTSTFLGQNLLNDLAYSPVAGQSSGLSLSRYCDGCLRTSCILYSCSLLTGPFSMTDTLTGLS